MKLRNYFLPLLLIVLVLTTTAPVKAGLSQQHPPDDLIRQVLTAIQQELGWNIPMFVDFPGSEHNYMIKNLEAGLNESHLNGMVYIWIRAYESKDLLERFGSTSCEPSSTIPGEVAEEYDFHGGTVCSIDYYGSTIVKFHVDRFTFEVWDYQENGLEAKAYLEILYRTALAHGLIVEGSAGDPSGTPEAITTVVTEPDSTPTITPGMTPEPGGGKITLVASAEGYEPVTHTIDNSVNLGSMGITGWVVDLDSGIGIKGATIKITSGAVSVSTKSTTDKGFYSLQDVPLGGDGGHETFQREFALQKAANLTVEIIPDNTELLADGKSTSKITIIARDLQGNVLKDKHLTFGISSATGQYGILDKYSGMTDDNGIIYVTYTAFKVESGDVFASDRHEIIFTVSHYVGNFSTSKSIFVSQYHLVVQYNQFIPACGDRCNYPSRFNITVLDPMNNPVPNVQLTLTSANSAFIEEKFQTPESSIVTDGNGQAVVDYIWVGRYPPTTSQGEYTFLVSIAEDVTNTSVTKEVKAQIFDLGIIRIEEVVGFTGYSGQQAFIKVYFQDYAYPNLELERFNLGSPNQMALRVEISRVNKNGVNELVYDNPAKWERDAGGLFVKMINTPYMPYVIPTVDGSNWFNVRIRPIDITDSVFLQDDFPPNNDTVFALETGSPEGWLHTWLKDGVLTPHNWFGVVFKCVARFLPGLGETISVIDYLNYIYAKDGYALGQNTAAMITEELQNRAGASVLTKLKASTLNNIIQCLQDGYRVYHETTPGGSSGLGGVCAALVLPGGELTPLLATDVDDAKLVRITQDRFVQGMLHDTPELRGVVVVGLNAGDLSLRDAAGQMVSDPDLMSVDGQVAVYLLPVDEDFQLEMSSDQAFDIGVYEAGDDDNSRKTTRHEVQTESRLIANMAIGGTSGYALELDYDNNGVFDSTQHALVTIMETVKPQITSFQPEPGVTVKGETIIKASYTDNTGGIGIDPKSVEIYVNGINQTTEAEVRANGLNLVLSDLEAGEYTVRLGVSDLDGNGVVTEWVFIVEEGFSFTLNNSILIFAVGGGVFLIFLLGGILFIWFMWRKRRQPASGVVQGGRGKQSGTVQDEQGRWWYQDPQSGDWSLWNGNAWQPATRQISPSLTPPRTPRRKTSGSCVFTLIAAFILVVLILGGISLIAFKFFPQYQIQMGQGDLTQILKMGGGGLLVSVLGLILLNGGFKSIITRRAVVEDDWGHRREKRGCLAVIDGLGRVLFGVLLLAGGLGMVALTLYQEVLPWLGF